MSKTIREAIQCVLKANAKPLSPKEIYDEIRRQGLYEFKVKDPIGVVRNQLRRNCDGVDQKNRSQLPIFGMSQDGRFRLLTYDPDNCNKTTSANPTNSKLG